VSGLILKMALRVVRGLVKDPGKKNKLRTILMEIRDAIATLYADE